MLRTMREREFAVYQPLGTVWARRLRATSRAGIRPGSGDVMKYQLNGYRIRYPDPAIKVNDTVKIDLATGKISDFIKFDTGVIVMITGGRNMVR